MKASSSYLLKILLISMYVPLQKVGFLSTSFILSVLQLSPHILCWQQLLTCVFREYNPHTSPCVGIINGKNQQAPQQAQVLVSHLLFSCDSF